MLASNSRKGSKTQDGVVGLDVQAAGSRPNYCGGVQSHASLCVYANMQGHGDVTSGVSFFAVHTYHAGEREKERREESRAGIAFYTPTYTRMQPAVSRLLIVYHLRESKYIRMYICVLRAHNANTRVSVVVTRVNDDVGSITNARG